MIPVRVPARAGVVVLLALSVVAPLTAQGSGQGRGAGQGRGGGRGNSVVITDTARARQRFVSNRPEDHPEANYESQMQSRLRTETTFAERAKGVLDFQVIRYRSKIGDLDVPAYLFQPLQKRGAKGHPGLIMVHGGVHGNMTATYWPFIREAVERGYVVITPNYRGSTGYGKEFHEAIDYGGYEVDDAMSAYDYMKSTLPHVDADRVGMMGWSHGGFITLHSIFRDQHPFKAGAAIVPVTNLIFRLSFKGPNYQRSFATMQRVQGLPDEKREEYVARSPFYHVHTLQVPLLVHVATNDQDVNYEEAQMLIWALRAQKPNLAETKIYVNPDPWGGSVGHAFSRRVDNETLERVDSPAQRDSWNRTWAFLEEHLRPYEDRSKPLPPVRTQ
ncbi:MAG: alpha/beta hydrolase family protein [Longimicrobiales bacterium]